MRVRFWGVRGSIPVPGPETAGYGGNTSCVEVVASSGHPLVLDCGTGARPLGWDLLRRKVSRVDILFSHFHMDHVFGFPFFGPIYSPGCMTHINIPAYTESEARDKLGRYLNGIYHPVRIRDIADRIQFNCLRLNQPFEIGPFRIAGVRLNHPGGAVGYRVEADGKSVVYLSDTAPLAHPNEGVIDGHSPPMAEARVIRSMKEADVVVMDTMFSSEEYLQKMTWGHSYPEYAFALAKEAGVKHLVLFHHAPDASDTALDALAKHWTGRDGPRVTVAREGETLDLEG